VSDNFHSCFFIPDLCGCRLCASDMSGLMRLLILCIRRPFFPSMTFFSGYFCTFLCSLPVLHSARSRSGGVRRVVLLQTRSCFCSVFFLSPPSCGGAVGGVPSVGDLHPTDKSKLPRVPFLLHTTQFTYVANNAVVLGCARTSSLSECAHQLCASKQ